MVMLTLCEQWMEILTVSGAHQVVHIQIKQRIPGGVGIWDQVSTYQRCS